MKKPGRCSKTVGQRQNSWFLTDWRLHCLVPPGHDGHLFPDSSAPGPVGLMNPIYLDACSTTRLDPLVGEAMIACYRAGYVNPASQHRPGQQAAARLEQARHQIGERLDLGPDDRLIFTSGGTEANNLALLGWCRGGLAVHTEPQRPNIVVSTIEHPSILTAVSVLGSRGWEVRRLPVDSQGCARLDVLPRLLDERTRLVSLMMVNNETGNIQPVAEAARICARRNIPMHCDAVQAVGKIPVRFRELAAAGVTALSLTAHKLHGPRGIGALVLSGSHRELTPLLFGGFQQLGLRPGTEDVALAVGFAEALMLADTHLATNPHYLQSLRDAFEEAVGAGLPDCRINGGAGPRAPHCSNIAFPGNSGIPAVERQPLMLACDMAGLAISTGSACASGSSEPSHVLQAMGLESRVISSSLRISFSRQNTPAESVQAANRIINAVKHLRRGKSGRN